MANWTRTIGAAGIPTYIALATLDAFESYLVLGSESVVDRSYESMLGPHNAGDTIKVFPISEINSSTARTKAADGDVTLDVPVTETAVSITVNTHIYQATKFEDIGQLQVLPNAVAKYTSKLGYTVAKKVDSDLGALFASFTSNRGTLNRDLTETVIDQAFNDLDKNEVPDTNRFWYFHVLNKPTIMNMERFINKDYTQYADFKPNVARKIAGDIYGAPVFFSTNATSDTSGHDCFVGNKEAIALVMSQRPRVQSQYKLESLGTLVVCDAIYGTKMMRNTDGGCWVKAR